MSRKIISPSAYVQGPNELDQLGMHASKFSKIGAFVIVDRFIMNQYHAQICRSFETVSLAHELIEFKGECSTVEIDRLLSVLTSSHADVVVGIGGGKALDTAKAVAQYAKLPMIICPTIASTDAPCSALSVLYTEEGVFDSYLFLDHNPNLVLVDSAIIAHAPTRLLVSGMGDALATYFEARASYQAHATTIAGGTCSLASLELAKLCYETLLRDGLQAMLAVSHNQTSTAVENIIEANTYLSGIGFESGGLAAAHAIHNGLTVLEETHHMTHGEKVAFGTITQLVLENAPLEEINKVIDFCLVVGLPTTLADLGLVNPTPEQLQKVAKACTVPTETIHNMPFTVTSDDVYTALLVADQLGC